MISVETFLRWQHPEKGDMPASKFILSAEESRVILPLGKWVLKQSCLHQVEWQKQGLSTVNISVNLSSLQFHESDLLATIEETIQTTGIQQRRLIIEITENTLMKKNHLLITKLNALRSMGVNIAIDNFGTGYSSLASLKQFSINHLKVDSEFTRQLPDNPRDAAITRSIIKMAHELGITVIAKGIEDRQQLQFLMATDCDFGQGFYIAKPMNCNDFTDWPRHHQPQEKSNIRSIC